MSALLLIAVATATTAGPTDTVVVTGRRSAQLLEASTTAVEAIDRQTILASGAENAAEALEAHPGVVIGRSFRGAGAEIRGFDANRVLVLVDGQRVAGRKDGQIDLSRYPAENIERIEVVKGAGSALYGSDALGGVINIITRKPDKGGVEGDAHASFGNRTTIDAGGMVGGRWDKATARLTAGYHRRDAYRLDPDSVATDGSAVSRFQGEANGDVQITDGISVEGRAGYTFTELDGVESNAAGAVFDTRNRTETFDASLQPKFRIGAGQLSLRGYLSMYRDQFIRDQRNSGRLDSSSETNERLYSGVAQLDGEWFDDHFITVGVDALYEELESDRLSDGYADRGRVALFAQDDWQILGEPKLAVVPGVRMILDTQFGAHFVPKVAVRYDPVDFVVLRASYGHAFRAPSFRELLLEFENINAGYVVVGEPSLQPERSRSYDLGATVQLPGKVSLSTTLYRNDLRDMITVSLVDDPGVGTMRFSYVNLARAYTQGIESGVTVGPWYGVDVALTYVLMDTKDLEEDRPIEGRAKHRGTFQLRYRLDSIGLSMLARGSFNGTRLFYPSEDETIEADPYVLVDLRVQQEIWDHFSAFAGIDNLLDTGDPDYLAIPPRLFYAGLNARY